MTDDLMVIERHDRLRRIALWFEAGALTPAQLNGLLAEWWTDSEWHGVGTRRVVRMFRHAGFVTDTEGVTAPTEAMTLYRGRVPHHARSGMDDG